MDSNRVWHHIDSERAALADLLESLPRAGLGSAEPVRRLDACGTSLRT